MFKKIIIAMVVGLSLVSFQPSQAATRKNNTIETRILINNIAGGALHSGSWEAFGGVEIQMREMRPQILLLQEVCYNQYQEFLQKYPSWTGHWSVSRPNHDKCPGNVPDLGDMVATIWTLKNPVTVKAHDVTSYGMAGNIPCGDVYIPDRTWPMHVCSIHASTTKHPVEHEAFMRAIQEHLDPYLRAGTATILGGDFNRLPNSEELAPFYSRMLEADDPHNEPTTGGAIDGTKIDYLFFKHMKYTERWADVIQRNRYSDHRIMNVKITGRP